MSTASHRRRDQKHTVAAALARPETGASRERSYLPFSGEHRRASRVGSRSRRPAQRHDAVAAVRGWTITAWYEDGGVSGGKAPHQRPGLAGALDAVQTGQAERLIVAKIDRLSRRFRDAVDLMETAADKGWPLYIADIDADRRPRTVA